VDKCERECASGTVCACMYESAIVCWVSLSEGASFSQSSTCKE
jgi:hypothetical protein